MLEIIATAVQITATDDRHFRNILISRTDKMEPLQDPVQSDGGYEEPYDAELGDGKITMFEKDQDQEFDDFDIAKFDSEIARFGQAKFNEDDASKMYKPYSPSVPTWMDLEWIEQLRNDPKASELLPPVEPETLPPVEPETLPPVEPENIDPSQ